MITGESMPVTKFENDEVIGSTMNKNGVITMEATKVGKDTALSSIVQWSNKHKALKHLFNA